MKIFLDTANIEEIAHASRLGLIQGVTTNPSLAAKEGIADLEDYRACVKQVTNMVDGPVSVEVVSDNPMEMIQQGREFSTWAKNVVVKLPSTPSGFEAMATLSREGIAINQTLCFSANQALLGAQAGASFVSPFVGRLDDEGQDGMQLIKLIADIFEKHKIQTSVLAASIRHPLHCVMAAQAGADIATVPYKVLMQMMNHSLTDSGMERFTKDWMQASQ
jgi:transaldolase